MIEAQTWEQMVTPTTREPRRRAFQALKMFDREVAKSDPLLIAIEDAFREADDDTLMWLTAQALIHVLGMAADG